jgi:hypothetical protein
MTTDNLSELDFATVFRDENGVIIITMKDHKKLDEYDVINVNLAIRHKTQGEPALKLFDSRANWSMNKAAKARAKMEHNSNATIARAVVVSNLVTAALMRFLQSFGTYNYPQKIFSDYEEAYNWLLEQGK